MGFTPGPNRYSCRELLKHPIQPAPPEPAPGDLAVLLYTGGTTGIPKAARLDPRQPHGQRGPDQRLAAPGAVRRRAADGPAPLFPLLRTHRLPQLAHVPGGQIIVLPRFEINSFIKAMQKYRPTMLPGVPTLFVALINDPRLPKLDLSALWACISGSAPLPLEVRDRFEALSGCRMMEGYGLTEAAPMTHLNPVQGKRPPGSMGMPLPGTLARVMDQETGTRELPPGEVGELVIQGPQVMQGYWRKPEETALVLRDGWLYTGDLARRDADGYFYIVERKKDLIISGGYKIYPREVEEVLYQHPGVQRGGGPGGARRLPGGNGEGGDRAPGWGGAHRGRHRGLLPPLAGGLQGPQDHRISVRVAQKPGGQGAAPGAQGGRDRRRPGRVPVIFAHGAATPFPLPLAQIPPSPGGPPETGLGHGPGGLHRHHPHHPFPYGGRPVPGPPLAGLPGHRLSGHPDWQPVDHPALYLAAYKVGQFLLYRGQPLAFPETLQL